jgi:CRP/FNR family transcriptional regulator, cyclic AMP receptor protein
LTTFAPAETGLKPRATAWRIVDAIERRDEEVGMANGTPELLKGLPDTEAAQIIALGRAMRLGAGQVLFDLGATADSIYLIRQGRVALTLPMQVGGREEDVMVEERGPGQAVGWSALIPPHRFTLKASALLETDLIGLPRQALLGHFAAHPAAGYAVITNVSAIVGQRLQVFQAMWLREIQRVVEFRSA